MAPPEYVTNLAFSVPSFIFVLSQKRKKQNSFYVALHDGIRFSLKYLRVISRLGGVCTVPPFLSSSPLRYKGLPAWLTFASCYLWRHHPLPLWYRVLNIFSSWESWRPAWKLLQSFAQAKKKRRQYNRLTQLSKLFDHSLFSKRGSFNVRIDFLPFCQPVLFDLQSYKKRYNREIHK